MNIRFAKKTKTEQLILEFVGVDKVGRIAWVDGELD